MLQKYQSHWLGWAHLHGFPISTKAVIQVLMPQRWWLWPFPAVARFEVSRSDPIRDAMIFLGRSMEIYRFPWENHRQVWTLDFGTDFTEIVWNSCCFFNRKCSWDGRHVHPKLWGVFFCFSISGIWGLFTANHVDSVGKLADFAVVFWDLFVGKNRVDVMDIGRG